MKILKLDATNSTNSYLKEICSKMALDNFTVVVTNNQTNGRGQMKSVWVSEKGKNLTFSVLFRWSSLEIENQFYISKAVSLAVYDVLSILLPSKNHIKWPNDIMAGQKKIAGILIENSVKKTKIYQSIIGIGLNINQEQFKNLPNATSMKLVSSKDYDLDTVLDKLLTSLKKQLQNLEDKEYALIDKLYIDRLYKLNTPTMFKDTFNSIFMGKIMGVALDGRLQIELENETIKEFNLKEVTLVT